MKKYILVISCILVLIFLGFNKCDTQDYKNETFSSSTTSLRESTEKIIRTPEEEKKFNEYKDKLLNEARERKNGIYTISLDGDDVFGSITENICNEVVKASVKKDQNKISFYIESKFVVIIKAGTKVKVIDSSFGLRKVKIIDGDLADKEFWIVQEAIGL